MRMINSAEATFKSSKGSGYGNLPSLVSEGLLDNSFLGEKAGYRYSIDASNTDYTAVATPLSSNTARFEYFSTSDAVIRYSTDATLAPNGRAGGSIE